MKLYFIFLLIDGLILLTYPFLYVANKVRRVIKLRQ